MAINIHGTYPFDSMKWDRVKELTLAEAAKLVGVEVTPEMEERAKGPNGVYLWLNKGYVIIGPDAPPTSQKMHLLALELLGGSPELSSIKPGMQAVYLHDGRYSLIERRA